MASRIETKTMRDQKRAIKQAQNQVVEALVREHGGKIPDHDIAAMADVGANRIFRTRVAMGISQYRPHGDTETKRKIVYEQYIVLGRPASSVGVEMGLTERQVRKIAQGAGWKRDREVWLKNSKKAQLASAVTRSNTWAAKRAEIAKTSPKAIAAARQLSDAELIARALEAGRVTVLPPGRACGTTQWENALHTAFPANVHTTQAQRAKAAKSRQMSAKAKVAA